MVMGLAYLSTPGLMTIATGGTFEKIFEGAMAYSDEHLTNLTQADGRLTYTGTPDVHVTIVCNINVKSGENAQVIQFRIAVNGNTVAGTNMTRDFTATNRNSCLSMSWVEILSTGDYVEVFGTSDTNGDEFTVNNLILTVVRH